MSDEMENKTLIVSVHKSYGREALIRPENELAEQFVKLLGQKTLTQENVDWIKRIGYVVKTKEEIL